MVSLPYEQIYDLEEEIRPAIRTTGQPVLWMT